MRSPSSRATIARHAIAGEQLFLTQHRGLGPVAPLAHTAFCGECPAASSPAPPTSSARHHCRRQTSSLAWQISSPIDDSRSASFEIRIARFTSSTRTWSAAQTLVPSSAQNARPASAHRQRCRRQRARAVDRETMRMRTALKAIRAGPCRRRLQRGAGDRQRRWRGAARARSRRRSAGQRHRDLAAVRRRPS